MKNEGKANETQGKRAALLAEPPPAKASRKLPTEFSPSWKTLLLTLCHADTRTRSTQPQQQKGGGRVESEGGRGLDSLVVVAVLFSIRFAGCLGIISIPLGSLLALNEFSIYCAHPPAPIHPAPSPSWAHPLLAACVYRLRIYGQGKSKAHAKFSI